ncbi:hypothetical protein PLICRDRAFT_56457 [Plicaturopsis crispa FD-325 SS-3]|nr:hypothetical protein PLICRDRAFT_56457 [Plicaturopsis crispa FD-325 SS-3]
MKFFAVLLPILGAFAVVRSRSVVERPNASIALDKAPATPRRSLPAECSNPVRDTCTFYADCLESQYHCGPDGYPIGYGQFYCTKFSNERDKLSAKGQTWMIDTMMCLQHAIVPIALDQVPNTTCDSLKDTAFGTHAQCYVDNGLCTLPPTDWLAIVEIVDIKTLFSSWDAFKATVDAADGCVEFYAWVVAKGLF